MIDLGPVERKATALRGFGIKCWDIDNSFLLRSLEIDHQHHRLSFDAKWNGGNKSIFPQKRTKTRRKWNGRWHGRYGSHCGKKAPICRESTRIRYYSKITLLFHWNFRRRTEFFFQADNSTRNLGIKMSCSPKPMTSLNGGFNQALKRNSKTPIPDDSSWEWIGK